jgi:hypothetical protein
MNKILVVIHVGTKDLSPGQVQEYFSKIYENLPSKNEGFFSFVLPDKESDSIRVECLNPVLLDESEYAKAKEKLDKLNERIKADYNI